MTVKTVDRPEFTVVGLNIHTKPLSPEIPALWPRFVARMGEIENPAERGVTYGVMRGDAHVLQYMAAVAVRSPGRIPQGMESLTIAAASYAVFSYPLSGLGKGFAEIYERLLPSAGLQPLAVPSFERYGADFEPHDPHAAVGVYIPVRR